MPTFRYQATDADGVWIDASIESPNEAHAQRYLRSRGLHVARFEPMLSGVGLHWREPEPVAQARTVVVCAWCSMQYRTRTTDGTCSHCGADLPTPEGRAAPPNAPRRLPRRFSQAVFFRRNEEGVMGLILLAITAITTLWTGNLLWGWGGGIAIALLGMTMTVLGFRRAIIRRAVLRRGSAYAGRVVDVTHNRRGSTWGNEVSFRVRYECEARDGRRSGELTTSDTRARAFQPGETVWVVALPQALQHSTLWPPIA